ncbi:MAG: hypothetical protein HY935_01150 [Nitrosomonadales bacterium]|nr:hypothetical protein [Nitrosomonadales bacterium]
MPTGYLYTSTICGIRELQFVQQFDEIALGFIFCTQQRKVLPGLQPLYLPGVPGKGKAQLAAIILQHLNAAQIEFNPMIIFQNAPDIPSLDLSRLMNAANDTIASIGSSGGFERKVLRHVK